MNIKNILLTAAIILITAINNATGSDKKKPTDPLLSPLTLPSAKDTELLLHDAYYACLRAKAKRPIRPSMIVLAQGSLRTLSELVKLGVLKKLKK